MAGSQMSKANQRQSGRRKAAYTAQFERTKVNKARKLWRALKRNPLEKTALAALQKMERIVLTRAGLPVDAPEQAHARAAQTTRAKLAA